MKTVIIPVVLLMISLKNFSQVRFGVFAGPQATTARYSINDSKQPHDYKYGFHAGFGWKIPFDNHLYFSPCAFYSLKGYKVTFNQVSYPPDSFATNNNTSIHTLELAFLLQFDLGDNPSHFSIKAGPSLDFQLSGKENYHLTDGSQVKRTMPYGFDKYGRYTASLLMQVGFEGKGGLLIFAHYNLGLGNLNNSDGGPSIKHRTFAISIGTYFNKKGVVLDTRNKE